MKNSKTLIIVLIAFTFGYVVRMFVSSNANAQTLDPTSPEIAQQHVDNFQGEPKFFVLSHNAFEAIQASNKEMPDNDGFVVYYAASEVSDEANETIAAAVKDQNVVSQYFMVNDKPIYDICPVMCDGVRGLTVHPMPTQIIDEVPTDSLNAAIEDEIAEDEDRE